MNSNLSPVDWAKRPLQKYADFSGRAPREVEVESNGSGVQLRILPPGGASPWAVLLETPPSNSQAL